jgi:hypothetical protein
MHQDIIEIEQLLYRLCHALDRGTVDEIVEVFHPDAVFVPRYQSHAPVQGRDALREWFVHLRYQDSVEASPPPQDHLALDPSAGQ